MNARRSERAAGELPGGAVAALLAPAFTLFVLFFVVPLCTIVLLSLLEGNPAARRGMTFSTLHYEILVEDTFYAEVLLTTLRMALFTTLAALALGYPVALRIVRARRWAVRTFMLAAVLASLMMGIVVRSFAWVGILAREGLVNTALGWLGIIASPLPLAYNEFAIVLALVHIYVPFMVLSLVGVVARIEPALEEAAATLGASPVRRFWEVTFPLSLPGVVSGCFLVFILASSAYVTPAMVGGFEVLTLPLLLYEQVSATFNLGLAAALGVVGLVTTIVLILSYAGLLRSLTRTRVA